MAGDAYLSVRLDKEPVESETCGEDLETIRDATGLKTKGHGPRGQGKE